jgi:predicted TIM-barrel fold metal-dependent hydrolase
MLIDVHAHYLPPFLLEALDAAGRRPALPNFPDWSPELALAAMESFGIERTILSVSTPGVHFGDDAAAIALARQCNDYVAGLQIKTDGRLDGFAAMPLPCIDGAIAEVGYALDALGMAGIGLLASYGDHFLGDAFFDPLMEELDRRSAIVFVHPMGHPTSRALGLAAPLWMVEYPLDTTRAAVNMIVKGTLTRFPRIRFILAHAGGTLPYLHARIAAASLVDPRLVALDPATISANISSFYYELAQASGPATFAALAAVAAPDRILFGSDFPYCGDAAVASMVRNLDGFAGGPAALTANARTLFSRADA